MAKGFKDSTRTQYGDFNFQRSSTPVKAHSRAMPAPRAKVAKVMHEFGQGDLHSGSDSGPKVSNPKQAIAIALSEAKRNPTKMAQGGALTAKHRNALPKSDFGLLGERKYPMPDKSHAANAKARASQQAAKGALSESAKAKIDAKANKVLHKAEGGAVKDVHKHERHMHPGKPLTKLQRGGAVPAHNSKPLIGC